MVSGQGQGTNLQSLLDACASGQIAGHVVVVIGTRADTPALERARTAGVAVAIVSPRKYENDDTGYGETLLREIGRAHV